MVFHTYTKIKSSFCLSVCSFMLGTANFRSFRNQNPIFSHCYEMKKRFHWFCHLALSLPFSLHLFVSLRPLSFARRRCANFFIVIPTRSIYRLETLFPSMPCIVLVGWFVGSFVYFDVVCLFFLLPHTNNNDEQNGEKIVPFLHFVA